MYDKAREDGLSHEKAVVACNVFRNAYFMGCKYNDNVMNESRKYWPEEAIKNPFYEEEDE